MDMDTIVKLSKKYSQLKDMATQAESNPRTFALIIQGGHEMQVNIEGKENMNFRNRIMDVINQEMYNIQKEIKTMAQEK